MLFRVRVHVLVVLVLSASAPFAHEVSGLIRARPTDHAVAGPRGVPVKEPEVAAVALLLFEKATAIAAKLQGVLHGPDLVEVPLALVPTASAPRADLGVSEE
jgi:hypothetical protein